jgi:hypothetical protein
MVSPSIVRAMYGSASAPRAYHPCPVYRRIHPSCYPPARCAGPACPALTLIVWCWPCLPCWWWSGAADHSPSPPLSRGEIRERVIVCVWMGPCYKPAGIFGIRPGWSSVEATVLCGEVGHPAGCLLRSADLRKGKIDSPPCMSPLSEGRAQSG